jgi:hypothetical protein
MIQVQNLTYSYPGTGRQVLKKISFEIKEGEIFGFLGPSGAGKSTTQKVLNGLLWKTCCLCWGPLLDFALPAPYNWSGAYSPLFWASRSLQADSHITFWLYASITFLLHLLLIWILFRKFAARSD